MRMPPALRKAMLSVHIIASVGWLGAVAAYLALDLTAASNPNVESLRAAWMGMGLLVRYVIVPLALVALVTGIIQSLGTKWGLLRHWWVLISLVLTLFATVVLLIETETVASLAAAASDPAAVAAGRGNTLFHSITGMVVLVVITVLNVFKPAGETGINI